MHQQLHAPSFCKLLVLFSKATHNLSMYQPFVCVCNIYITLVCVTENNIHVPGSCMHVCTFGYKTLKLASLFWLPFFNSPFLPSSLDEIDWSCRTIPSHIPHVSFPLCHNIRHNHHFYYYFAIDLLFLFLTFPFSYKMKSPTRLLRQIFTHVPHPHPISISCHTYT